MTPPIVTKFFLCPVIGTGKEHDGYRPLISAMLKHTSMAMHRLNSLPTHCMAVVTGPVNEVNKLNTQLDVILVPTAQSVQMLRDLYGQAVVDEVQAWWPIAEKIRIYPPHRRKKHR